MSFIISFYWWFILQERVAIMDIRVSEVSSSYYFKEFILINQELNDFDMNSFLKHYVFYCRYYRIFERYL